MYTSRSFAQKFGKEGSFAQGKEPSVIPWRVLFWVIFSCGVGMILTAALVALGLCWRVSKVEVKGSEFHEAEAVIEAAGISEGDLVLGFDAGDVERALRETYPILRSVQIQRYPDGSVILNVSEEETLYYTCHRTNYYLISGDGMRVIHISSEDALYRAYGAIYLGLPEEAELKVGKRIDFSFLPYEPVGQPEQEQFTYEIVTGEADEEYAYVLSLTEMLEESPFFASLDGLDAADRYDLYFVCNRRIMVRLGDTKELDRKLEQALYIITHEMKTDEIPAVIDVSDPAKSTLRQNPELEMPAWCKIE